MKKNKKKKKKKNLILIENKNISISNESKKVNNLSMYEKRKNNNLILKKQQQSINRNKINFINEIELLRIKNILTEESYSYLKELTIKLSNKNGFLNTPEKKMLELEISNRKLLDWQKNRFESKKYFLKEKTQDKISTLFADFDNYMWKGKLASFSELRNLSKILAKKI